MKSLETQNNFLETKFLFIYVFLKKIQTSDMHAQGKWNALRLVNIC